VKSSLLLRIAPLLLLTCRLATAQETIPPIATERAVISAFESGKYELALELIETFLVESPDNIEMLYNAACAKCKLNDRDGAAEYLLRAVKAGFRDFTFMDRDPDLRVMRDHPTYEAIVEAAKRVDESQALDALARWRSMFGDDDYTLAEDDVHRLHYAAALDDTSFAEMRSMLERQADQMIAAFFGGPPDYHVLIAVPTPKDAVALFGDDRAVGGIYQHYQRRLIARDIGSSLRHEFFHLLHYGHMERLGQDHPIWIQEGMASLYEDYEFREDGAITFLPNDRHNIVRRRARIGGLMKWRQLFDTTRTRFMGKATALYPQVRSIFEFVADEGLLAEWYAAYVASFDEDDSGVVAFEAVFNAPLESIERQWRTWMMARPELDLEVGDAGLGIRSGDRISNDGVLVTSVIPRSSAARAGIRNRDVIVSADGRPTRSLQELKNIIGAKSEGDPVKVRFRRVDQYHVVTVILTRIPEPQRRRRR
jgi:hypothetical protein